MGKGRQCFLGFGGLKLSVGNWTGQRHRIADRAQILLVYADIVAVTECHS
jgi:hypothetical protein